MLGVVDGIYEAMNAHQGDVPEGMSADCHWVVNGQALSPCAAPFSGGAFNTIARTRDRQVVVVDEARGLVAVSTFEDWPSVPRSFKGPDGTSVPNGTDYPKTQQVIDLFRFAGGKVQQIDAFTSELPYGMKPHR